MRTILVKLFLIGLTMPIGLNSFAQRGGQIHIRINQVGYLENESKIALAFSNKPIKKNFRVVHAETRKEIFRDSVVAKRAGEWGNFEYYYALDFSQVKQPGRYYVTIGPESSNQFGIGRKEAYKDYHEDLVSFVRQQRCGYNPFLDMVCHQRDGRTMYGPMPDSTYIDLSGGWHDAGDQLKYLITSSNATARMLMAFELAPKKFGDLVDKYGRKGPNGIPDVLDEAKWGLEWIHKMHYAPGKLFHQIADDRDHIGMKWPDKDSSDYGWGPDSYRVAYYASGKPQGLKKFKSSATGIANIAGRSAAAMAIAARIWRNYLDDPIFALKCEKAAKNLYAMGKKQEGFQQGNSYGAPYRYNEDTWADDMEWAAAELYSNTKKKKYLQDAIIYAKRAGTISWMNKDFVEHYRYYPFINVGHFVLYKHVGPTMKKKLQGYYRKGIEQAVKRGNQNPFGVGVPFVWCSNNLVVALATQIILYEKMTGDENYHSFLLAQRDWLLGKNPWGSSMFMNIPRGGEFPEEVHTSVWFLTRKQVPGGLVDGPIYRSVFNQLKGLRLKERDELEEFQNHHVVYHDDFGDYSTNEPTMDGTAGAIFFLAHYGSNSINGTNFGKGH